MISWLPILVTGPGATCLLDLRWYPGLCSTRAHSGLTKLEDNLDRERYPTRILLRALRLASPVSLMTSVPSGIDYPSRSSQKYRHAYNKDTCIYFLWGKSSKGKRNIYY